MKFCREVSIFTLLSFRCHYHHTGWNYLNIPPIDNFLFAIYRENLNTPNERYKYRRSESQMGAGSSQQEDSVTLVSLGNEKMNSLRFFRRFCSIGLCGRLGLGSRKFLSEISGSIYFFFLGVPPTKEEEISLASIFIRSHSHSFRFQCFSDHDLTCGLSHTRSDKNYFMHSCWLYFFDIR
jgi:hypothetical protein